MYVKKSRYFYEAGGQEGSLTPEQLAEVSSLNNISLVAKSWENIGNILGKYWENIGKISRKISGKYQGKYQRKYWVGREEAILTIYLMRAYMLVVKNAYYIWLMFRWESLQWLGSCATTVESVKCSLLLSRLHQGWTRWQWQQWQKNILWKKTCFVNQVVGCNRLGSIPRPSLERWTSRGG